MTPADRLGPLTMDEALRQSHLSRADVHQCLDMSQRRWTFCRSDNDGDCDWDKCPQIAQGEPQMTGRHCPLDRIRNKDDDR